MVTPENSNPTGAEKRLQELGIKLPSPPKPFGIYAEAVQTGNLLFLTGMLPTEGRAAKFVGRIGAELDVEAGRQSRSSRGAQSARRRARISGIARQGDANRPARRVGGHLRRCSRSAESRRRRFGAAPGRVRREQKPLPLGLWRGQSSPRHAGGTGRDFRSVQLGRPDHATNYCKDKFLCSSVRSNCWRSPKLMERNPP